MIKSKWPPSKAEPMHHPKDKLEHTRTQGGGGVFGAPTFEWKNVY